MGPRLLTSRPCWKWGERNSEPFLETRNQETEVRQKRPSSAIHSESWVLSENLQDSRHVRWAVPTSTGDCGRHSPPCSFPTKLGLISPKSIYVAKSRNELDGFALNDNGGFALLFESRLNCVRFGVSPQSRRDARTLQTKIDKA